MQNIKNIFIFVIVFTGIILSACSAGPSVDWELNISGAVENSLKISYSELAAMPQTDLSDLLMNKSIGEDEVKSWSGVKLEDLLKKANFDSSYTTITAFASDGYAIEITKDELKDAVVALKENGDWIQKTDPEHGPIRLVCPQTPANRWVFQLTEIQVNK